MADFMIRFLLCSLFLGVVICLFLAVKRICSASSEFGCAQAVPALSERNQYHKRHSRL